MRHRRTQATVFLSALALTLLVVSACASAVARAGELAAKREQAREMTAEVAILDEKLDVAVADYGVAAQRLADLQERMRANRDELAVTEYQLGVAQKLLAARTATLYKDDQVSFLDVVLSTRSFDELLTALDYERRIEASDAQMIDTIESHRAAIDRQRADLEKQAADAQSLVADQLERKAAIERSLGERRQMLGSVQADVRRLVNEARQRAREAAERARAAARARSAASSAATPDPSGLSGSGRWWTIIKAEAGRRGLSADGMYRLMISESGGCATADGGGFYGLFQYCTGTWNGSWNPWRSQSIYDGEAQIKATALAISMGKGPYWWPNTYPWAFGR